jgi:hypothetical protein
MCESTRSQTVIQTGAEGSLRWFLPLGAEIAEMLNYFQAHTYLGSDSSDRIALANKIAGRQPTRFSSWARLNIPVTTA